MKVMNLGLIWEIIKKLEKDDNNLKTTDSNIEETGKILGLSPEEIEECKKCGIAPEEWAEDNDPDYEE